MNTKRHSDVDYNDLVRGVNRYVGRGWNLGGHTLNNNSTSYGVCVIGLDGDATAEDQQTVREIYEEVCAVLGRRIHITDHRNLLGSSYTDCPGNELDAWVDKGMPYPSGGVAELDPFENAALDNVNRATWALINDLPSYDAHPNNVPDPEPLVKIENKVHTRLDAIAADIAALKARPPVTSAPVDVASLKAALLDPGVAAALAAAVNDDNAERMRKR